MTEPARHAAFIEPDELLRETICAWKTRVAARWPNAVYLPHPPHCTLWVGAVRDASAARAAVESAVAAVAPLTIDRLSPHVFAGDALAKGGQTCAFAAPLSEPLAALQRAVCEAVRLGGVGADDEALPAGLRHGPVLASWRRFGFAFAGPHWIPHFTVAAIPAPPGDALVAEFMNAPAAPATAVRHVSWWRIEDDSHERMAELPLGGRTR